MSLAGALAAALAMQRRQREEELQSQEETQKQEARRHKPKSGQARNRYAAIADGRLSWDDWLNSI